MNFTATTLTLAVLFGFGCVLFVIGLWGRRVNDHPFCRKCRFDLFGNPDAKTCSECGSNLQGKRAIKTGPRKRRGSAMGWGITLAALSLIVYGGYEFNRHNGPGLNLYNPQWLLVYELHSPYTPQATAASDALLQRYSGNKKLTDIERQRLIAIALDLQGNRAANWDTAWGDLIEAERIAGIVTDEQWLRYLEQVCEMTFEVKPLVRAGAEIPCRITARHWRSSQNLGAMRSYISFASLKQESETYQLTWPVKGTGHQISPRLLNPQQFMPLTRKTTPDSTSDFTLILNELDKGAAWIAKLNSPQSFPLQIGILWVGDWGYNPDSPEFKAVVGDAPIFKNAITHDTTFHSELNLLPSTQQIIRLISKPKILLEHQLATAEIEPVILTTSMGQQRITTFPKVVLGSISGKWKEGFPTMIMDMELRQGENVWKYEAIRIDLEHEFFLHNPLQRSAGANSATKHLVFNEPNSLHLIPNIEAAEKLFDVHEIWGDEIVFENLKLKVERPVRRTPRPESKRNPHPIPGIYNYLPNSY